MGWLTIGVVHSLLRRLTWRKSGFPLAIASAFGLSLLGLAGGCADESEGLKAVASDERPIERKRRSIVLITVDTTRPDHIEPYGSQIAKTPVLQRLADEGTLMEQAYAVAPLTLPAHTSILTGLYPLETAVRNNGTHSVSPDLSTLAERFSAAGYRSGAFVSAAVLERRYGLDQGFEIYDDDLSKSRMRLPRMVADRPAEYTVAAARDWLDTVENDESFFLWLHLYDPHAVYNPPPRFREQYESHLYAGEIAYMDEQIGELLAHERIGSAPDVVVSVIGDHGESLGDHGENTHGILAYRSTLHVPWILWIKDAPSGRRLTPAVSQVDLAPTLLDLAGLLEPDHGMAGQSLLREVDPERSLYSESILPYATYGWAPLHVLRRGRWEYIDAPSPELYDLVRDPEELSNQTGRLPEVEADLARRLDAFRQEKEAANGIEQELEIDQAALERLRALGYVSMQSEPVRIDGPRLDPKTRIQFHTTHERARTFIGEGLHAEAANLLSMLLEEDPNNLAALADLAHARQQVGQLDEAAEVVGRALGLDSNHQQLLTMLARIEAERGNQARSIELADRVIAANRANLDAWVLKAQAQSKLGDSEAARATLTEAFAIDAQSPLLNTLYAQLVELPDGKFVEAEQRLRLAAARDPFLTVPWRVLGRLLEKQGRVEEAEAAYQQGLEYTPDDASLHALYAVLLARRDHPNAEAHLREAIRRENEFRGELYVSLGAQLAKRGRHAEAHAAYDKVLDADPGHPAARNNRAIALAQSGHVEEAHKELESIVKDQPQYADARNNLAVILLSLGDPVGAEEQARKSIEISPVAAEAWDTLGASLLEQGRESEAIEALDASLGLAPRYWSALLNRGQAKAVSGDATGARQDLMAALVENDALPDAYFELGRLSDERLAEPVDARNCYRVFLDKFPHDPRASDVREKLSRLVTQP